MIADTSPICRIGPASLANKSATRLKLQPDDARDQLGSFFSTLSWTDRQILALHFAERLSPWEIHITLSLSMSDVLCRIQRLKRIARQSMQHTKPHSAVNLSLKLI